eukprot:COSAG01_NODE_2193_length_8183_cov_3.620609_4_plen_433_part_00
MMPYRHIEDNILRAACEVHLFAVLLLVLCLKSDLRGELMTPGDYDLVVTIMFIIFVPGAALVTVGYKWSAVVSDEIQNDVTPTARLKSSFDRHRLGCDKDDDRQLLGDHFARLEDEVNSDWHVFISYRVASEAAFARQLYDALSTMVLVETGQKLRVYLDQVSLKDGARWDEGFMNGLSASWIVVPILSTKAIQPMSGLDQEAACDNVLLEWMTALELQCRGQVKAIIPIIACDDSGEGFSWTLPKELSKIEHTGTTSAAKNHLRKHDTSHDLQDKALLSGAAQVIAEVDPETPAGEVTVSGVVAAILRFQGVLLTDRAAIDVCTDRIYAKVSALLNDGGIDRENQQSQQLKRVQMLWTRLDSDDLGSLATEQVRQVMDIMGGPNMDDAQFTAAMVAMADSTISDGPVTVSFEQFAKWWSLNSARQTPEQSR